LLQQAVRLPVFIYQKGSDNQDFGRCPFHPSCSVFALRAIEQFGAVEGSLMAADRLLRCNPWAFRKYPLSGDGYLGDPVEANALWNWDASSLSRHLLTSESGQ
jgi:putative component of membrane protein insertase Oxa1/YidC/SpoIIIJ protein YidD